MKFNKSDGHLVSYAIEWESHYLLDCESDSINVNLVHYCIIPPSLSCTIFVKEFFLVGTSKGSN